MQAFRHRKIKHFWDDFDFDYERIHMKKKDMAAKMTERNKLPRREKKAVKKKVRNA